MRMPLPRRQPNNTQLAQTQLRHPNPRFERNFRRRCSRLRSGRHCGGKFARFECVFSVFNFWEEEEEGRQCSSLLFLFGSSSCCFPTQFQFAGPFFTAATELKKATKSRGTKRHTHTTPRRLLSAAERLAAPLLAPSGGLRVCS